MQKIVFKLKNIENIKTLFKNFGDFKNLKL